MEPRFAIKCCSELIALTIPEMEKVEVEIRSLLMERAYIQTHPEKYDSKLHVGIFAPEEIKNLSQGMRIE